MDLYCGIGTITLVMARQAGRAIGGGGDPRRSGGRPGQPKGVENGSFFAPPPPGVVGGPPRDLRGPAPEGDLPEVVEAIVQMAPQRVVYVSCDPATLGRDVKLAAGGGLPAPAGGGGGSVPADGHVETVVLLSKGEVDSKKIRVEFSLEDMDMSEFQDGATYPQIKEYVLEHTGLKVSNLYISQIKRKCGIGVGKNYNLPKSEDSRQPQCPQEKEKAIREAFKYFGMI